MIGAKYKYNLDEDVEFAFKNGATAVISSHDEEMFPDDYISYIDQGESYNKLAGEIVPVTIKGMITGCIRWINFTQPTRSYFGLKDIEQSVLVKRAVKDLLINCEIVYVPCARYKNGIPISSRLMGLNDDLLNDVCCVYKTLTLAREFVFGGEKNSENVINFIKSHLSKNLKNFGLLHIKITNTSNFQDIVDIKIPFIIQIAIEHDKLKHFDGQLITSEDELKNGSPVIWLEK